LFSYGFPLYIGLVLNILHSRYVQFYVEDTLGVASLAILALATRIGEMLWLFDAVLINASLFRITASATEDSIRITQRLAKAILILQAGFAIGLGAISPFIIPLVFGEQFRPSVGVLILLLPGIVAWSVSRVLSQFVAYHKGRPVFNTGIAFIGFVCNILLVLFLTPVMGVRGAAIASTLSYSTVLVCSVVVFLRLAGTSIRSTFVLNRDDLQLAKSILRDYLASAGINRLGKS
jgi:O-antigen/teichoic acid export membrane protein